MIVKFKIALTLSQGVVLSRQLFRSTAMVGGMTLISRLLGFVRDMLIARFFGVDSSTDAFFVAFKIPNFMRRLFAEGAFSHAFVPAISEYQQRADKQALKQFLDKTAGSLSFALVLLTAIMIIIAPMLMWLLAPGFTWQGEQHTLAVQLLRLMLPYLLFIVLVAYAGSILNAHGQFFVPALTPALLNISMIIATVWFAPMTQQPLLVLAGSVLAAGIIQLLMQVPALMKLGLMPCLRLDYQDVAVKRLIKQLLPALFSVSVTQINLLLDSLFASFLAVGSVSWLYYSDRLVEFPLGILGLALATVILPILAKHHALNDPQQFSASLDWGLRLVLLIGLPASTGLILLAKPLLSTLFQYHEFTVQDVHFSAQSLSAYALGLPAYFMIKILVPGFTARQDLTTPVRYAIYAMVLSLCLNVLAIPFAHAGLALATSLGALCNALLLLNQLCQTKFFRPSRGWWLFISRISFACFVMAVTVYLLVNPDWWNSWSATMRALHLLKWITISIVIYCLGLAISGLRWRHLQLSPSKTHTPRL
jgi:putative peptidoglycan lipid II flippase